ncbi:hypothetical protein Ddc_18875 [Ditylenchus destructor]|nr:hypothetical protein Ddc_18875 [Ditylenchus destructor]
MFGPLSASLMMLMLLHSSINNRDLTGQGRPRNALGTVFCHSFEVDIQTGQVNVANSTDSLEKIPCVEIPDSVSEECPLKTPGIPANTSMSRREIRQMSAHELAHLFDHVAKVLPNILSNSKAELSSSKNETIPWNENVSVSQPCKLVQIFDFALRQNLSFDLADSSPQLFPYRDFNLPYPDQSPVFQLIESVASKANSLDNIRNISAKIPEMSQVLCDVNATCGTDLEPKQDPILKLFDPESANRYDNDTKSWYKMVRDFIRKKYSTEEWLPEREMLRVLLLVSLDLSIDKDSGSGHPLLSKVACRESPRWLFWDDTTESCVARVTSNISTPQGTEMSLSLIPEDSIPERQKSTEISTQSPVQVDQIITVNAFDSRIRLSPTAQVESLEERLQEVEPESTMNQILSIDEGSGFLSESIISLGPTENILSKDFLPATKSEVGSQISRSEVKVTGWTLPSDPPMETQDFFGTPSVSTIIPMISVKSLAQNPEERAQFGDKMSSTSNPIKVQTHKMRKHSRHKKGKQRTISTTPLPEQHMTFATNSATNIDQLWPSESLYHKDIDHGSDKPTGKHKGGGKIKSGQDLDTLRKKSDHKHRKSKNKEKNARKHHKDGHRSTTVVSVPTTVSPKTSPVHVSPFPHQSKAKSTYLQPIDKDLVSLQSNQESGQSSADDSKNNLDLLLPLLTRPAPPKGTILWKELKVPFPMVYFTITIVDGPLAKGRRPPSHKRRRADGARIYLMGLNMPTGYTQVTEGNQLKGTNAALVRTLDPHAAGPFVEFKLRVENKYGTSCKQMCLQSGDRYGRCARRIVRLSTYPKFSDPIGFFENSNDAIDAQWTGRGYYRRRKFDYLLFRCD